MSHPKRNRSKSTRILPYTPIEVHNYVDELSSKCTEIAHQICDSLLSKYNRKIAEYLQRQDRRRTVVDISMRENPFNLEFFSPHSWFSKTGQVALVILKHNAAELPVELLPLYETVLSNVRITSTRALSLDVNLSLIEQKNYHMMEITQNGQFLTGYDFEKLELPLRIIDPLTGGRPKKKVFRRGYNDKGSLASDSQRALRQSNLEYYKILEIATEVYDLALSFHMYHLNGVMSLRDYILENSELNEENYNAGMTFIDTHPELFKRVN